MTASVIQLAEHRANRAWSDYAAATQAAIAALADPTTPTEERRSRHEIAIHAERRFKRLFLALDQEGTGHG